MFELDSPFFGVVNGLVHLRGSANEFAKEWGQLPQSTADLSKMSPSNFRFLVHAAQNVEKIEIMMGNEKYFQQSIHFSASLVDQNHRGTYGHIGVIISAHPENIIATRASDMGAQPGRIIPESDMQKAEKSEPYYSFYKSKYPVQPPEALLKETSWYSEIVVAGTTLTQGPVNVVGVFLKTKDGTPVASTQEIAIMVEYAKRNNLPVLHIEADPDLPY